jgi:hypothetical protein
MPTIPCAATQAVMEKSQNAADVISRWLSLGFTVDCL